MSAEIKIRADVEFGPFFRTALDLLEIVDDSLAVIPEWHIDERNELESRADALREILRRYTERKP